MLEKVYNECEGNLTTMNFKDIKFLREANNMTQNQLAKMLNVSRCAIAQWETGKANPKLKHITMLCEIFGCSFDFFFDKKEKQ